MEKKFKAESKQLLELMIHSIYSNKEVFLRELVSNASDALDKRHFISLQDKEYENSNPYIEIDVNQEKRIISIFDNGIGMDKEEIESNLGTIAHSGSKEFIKQLEEGNDIDVIGQFGVGFYSSFIVSDNVEVISKKVNEQAYKWSSDGVEAYKIEEDSSNQDGTLIKLYIKEGEDFDKFLDKDELENLIKKYSDFIKYPIIMDKEIKHYDVDEEGNTLYDKYEIKNERTTINSMKALWKRDKKDISKEEYDNFYMSKFHDWQAPSRVIHRKAEGALNYEMLLFIPSHKGFNFYSNDYKIQIDLYSKSVFIEGECEYLISDAFKFVKGIVDSEDLSLNISREMLQKDSNVIKLSNAIEKRVKSELLDMLNKDRENYEAFYDEFGQQLVYGIYENFGAKKDVLKDLILFKSTKEDKYVSFKEYLERKPEEQKEILFITGSSIEQIKKLPVMEKALSDNQEILYFINEVDEFAINVLSEYEGVPFKSITSADYSVDEASKEEIAKTTDDNKDLLELIKEELSDKVSDVTLTSRLKTSPAALVFEEGISIEMEKTLAQMPDNQGLKATKVLEINPDHELFKVMSSTYQDNKDDIKDYAKVLYNQSLLIEGLEIEDPVEYTNLLTKIMINANK
ncbi:MAG: molecular chaperone HtpG [Erysipelotrichales bacterium]